jgi:quercetin dioxygenase-like cupin family protein
MTLTTTAQVLPGERVPYVLEAGGGRAHLLIDQVGRCLSGAEETGGALSMMTLDGPSGRPIPLHFHRDEYEFFYCHRGSVQLWLNTESRVLHPGDFGYAPPGTVHAYGLLGHHSGFVGPIVPGGWDRFFDLTGIPYSESAPFPVGFQPEIPFAKFGQAEQEFNMKYLPDAEYAAPRSDAPDDALPGSSEPYFLRAGEGPRRLVGGMLVTSLCTGAETAGQLSMLTVEVPRGAGVPAHSHEQTTEGLYVLEGALRVWLDDGEHIIGQGDYASIPSGAVHRWEGAAFFTKAIAISTPGGLEQVLSRLGEPTGLHMFGGDPTPVSADALGAAAVGADVTPA